MTYSSQSFNQRAQLTDFDLLLEIFDEPPLFYESGGVVRYIDENGFYQELKTEEDEIEQESE